MSNKIMYIFTCLFICTCPWLPLQAATELPEVLKPNQLVVYNNRVIVTQGHTVMVYSLDDLKLAVDKFAEVRPALP